MAKAAELTDEGLVRAELARQRLARALEHARTAREAVTEIQNALEDVERGIVLYRQAGFIVEQLELLITRLRACSEEPVSRQSPMLTREAMIRTREKGEGAS